MLKLSNDNDTDNNQQKPGADFAEADHLPRLMLIRILPGIKERCDVLGQPDKKAHDYKRQCQRHPVCNIPHTVDDPGPPEHEEHQPFKPPAEIRNKMMGKKFR